MGRTVLPLKYTESELLEPPWEGMSILHTIIAPQLLPGHNRFNITRWSDK